MPLPKLFFFHNPKAAGTSLMKAIREKKGDGQSVCTFTATITNCMEEKDRYSSLSGFDLYLGHYDRFLFDHVNDGHKYITNFRNPVTRVLSLYNYFKIVVPETNSHSEKDRIDFYCVNAAKTMSFSDFVRCDHPYVRRYTSDHHFRQLTASQWISQESSTSIDDACLFIDGSLCYYVCEHGDLSIRYVCDKLGLEHIPHDNTSHDKPGSLQLGDVDTATYDAIMDINQRDMAIYLHAVSRLEAWGEISGHAANEKRR